MFILAIYLFRCMLITGQEVKRMILKVQVDGLSGFRAQGRKTDFRKSWSGNVDFLAVRSNGPMFIGPQVVCPCSPIVDGRVIQKLSLRVARLQRHLPTRTRLLVKWFVEASRADASRTSTCYNITTGAMQLPVRKVRLHIWLTPSICIVKANFYKWWKYK